MTHLSFWQNEPTRLLAAAPPAFQGEWLSLEAAKLHPNSAILPFLGGGAALQAAEKIGMVTTQVPSASRLRWEAEGT